MQHYFKKKSDFWHLAASTEPVYSLVSETRELQRVLEDLCNFWGTIRVKCFDKAVQKSSSTSLTHLIFNLHSQSVPMDYVLEHMNH